MELTERVEQLELELVEFQESSKELELALEDELSRLENSNSILQQQLKKANDEINAGKAREKALAQQILEAQEASRAQKRENEEKINQLTKRLVAIEVANESMELNDRIYASKIELAQQMNNDLLERIALLEDEVQRERELVIQKNLLISNYENSVAELQQTISKLQGNSVPPESFEGDHLVLSMRDVLISETKRLPKSDSLHRLRELTEMSHLAAKEANIIRHSIILPEGMDTSTGPRNKATPEKPRVFTRKLAESSQLAKPRKTPVRQNLLQASSNSHQLTPTNLPTRKKSRRIFSSLRAFTKAAQQPVK